MTQQNPWAPDPNQPSDPAEGSSGAPNPWSAGSAPRNPWESNPETTSFPPVAGQNVQGAAHASYQGPGSYQAQTTRNNGWILPVIIVALLLALIAAGAVIARQAGILSFGATDTGEPVIVTEIVVAPEEERVDAPPAPPAAPVEQEVARPSRASLPASAFAANASARAGNPDGNFDNVYTGSSVTSQEFAQQVRVAFVDYHLATGQTTGTITAYSPVTGLSYSMNCTDNGDYVTCTGGNNAVVYIS